jgi:uncharacterized protein
MSADLSPTPEAEPLPPGEMDSLLALQELDLSIDRLSSRKKELESEAELRGAGERMAETEARLGELQMGLDAVSTEQRRLETTIDMLQHKIDDETKRLFDGTVANPKELQSIEAEVGSLRNRKSRVEDELLDQMERREDMERRQRLLESELAEARARLAEIESTSARELVEIEHALAQRAGERDAIVSKVDPEVYELYEDLRPQKKGVAAAAVVDGVCQGCHQKLSAVYLDRLKRTEGVRRCEYCRRILVFS